MNNLFIEIAIIPYNENKLRNSKEIVNKYHNINNDQSNKNNDENQNKSSFPTGIIIFLIIVFILFVLYLMLRIYRKRSIAKMNDYFRDDFPISN
jgi:ATP-dependent Zn protease